VRRERQKGRIRGKRKKRERKTKKEKRIIEGEEIILNEKW